MNLSVRKARQDLGDAKSVSRVEACSHLPRRCRKAEIKNRKYERSESAVAAVSSGVSNSSEFDHSLMLSGTGTCLCMQQVIYGVSMNIFHVWDLTLTT